MYTKKPSSKAHSSLEIALLCRHINVHSPLSPAGGQKGLLLDFCILDTAFKTKKEAIKEQHHRDHLRKTFLKKETST